MSNSSHLLQVVIAPKRGSTVQARDPWSVINVSLTALAFWLG